MNIKEYIHTHKERFLNELFELLRIPSVSADPTCNLSVRQCAQTVGKFLKKAGLDNVRLQETGGHPVVVAEKFISEHLPTVLVYGHYDVQPADPLELWDAPPFEPYIKEDKIYARGSCDDKGQMFMHVKAIEYLLNHEKLPCNVKFLIEGEEEIGSEHLQHFLTQNAQDLACDVILISDTSLLANDTPTIDCGLRGLSYLEVELTGPNRDLHSGVYGGAVENPIHVLCAMLASLHDSDGRIQIPGFYDKVENLSEEERAELAKIPFDEAAYMQDLGVKCLHYEKGYSTTERATLRPTLDVNGIWGGYTGEGAKTIIPSKAYAKISMRLVPNQKSDDISALFEKHFQAIAPPTVKVKITHHHGGEPVVTPVTSIMYKAASRAMEESFGKKPIPTRGGGSIPIVAWFEKILGAKSVLLGFGLDSDNIHSPNEHFGLYNFFKGIETITHFYAYYTEWFLAESNPKK